MLSTAKAKIHVSMEAYLNVMAFVKIEPNCFGSGVKGATAGLKLEGGLGVSCVITVDGKLRFVRPFLLCIAILCLYCKEILQITAFQAV